MPAHIHLIAIPGTETAEVSFKAAWAAPSPKAAPLCAPARLDTGDGHLIDLGLLCAPTAVTWCEQRQVDLAVHRYGGSGPYTAQLRWGDAVTKADVVPGRPGMLSAHAFASRSNNGLGRRSTNLVMTADASARALADCF